MQAQLSPSRDAHLDPNPTLLRAQRAPKIAMVGGGSYNWCPRLLCDLVQAPELSGSRIFLLDPNRQAAEDVKAAMDRICRDNNKDFEFIVTQDEDEAFSDVDFVVITISTGGLEMMKSDLEIPDNYGIYQTVADSVGPGGWSRLLRNIPVFTGMAKKIERLSPQAVILNYTNPMAGLTGAISQVTKLRHVGLCHGVVGTTHFLSKIFDVSMEDISVRFGGVNHFFWILDFKVCGKNGYELLRERLGPDSLLKYDKVSKDPAGFSDKNHEVFSELFENYGRLTYVADRHTCEYFSRYLTNRDALRRYKLVRTSIEERYKMLEEAKKVTMDMAEGRQEIFEPSVETAVDIIKAMVMNKPFVDVVNLPNQGQIENLPRGAVVETLGVVSPAGFSPVAVGPLPTDLRQLTEVHCHVQMMTLEAGMTGDRDLAMKALMLDPLCAGLSPSDVKKMGGELMATTKRYLPQFATSKR